jgi:septal ring factor EnvC (AmiA/AmiB activator)
MRLHGSGDAFGRRALWLIAAILAATWAPQLRAEKVGQSPGVSTRPVQTPATPQAEPQAAQDANQQGPQSAETLARELAAAKRDLDTLLRLLNRACSVQAPGAPAKLDADPGSADLRKSFQAEHDRASRLEQDLAAARRDVATQTALAAKASDQACQLKTAADTGSADLRKSLQQEHERASGLEQELAAARRDVTTQTALAAKASDEAKQLKSTADAGSADLRKSLQQERDRASVLERDLAAARREAETQTALAAKAGDEAKQLKSTADAGSADLRKSLQQERERASGLERDLAAARRDVETQTALAAKAGDEAKQLKSTAEDGSADLRKSLQQERDRASGLERDLAAARRDVETQTALAAKASDEAKQAKKTTDASAADLQKSLDHETERANRLGRGLVAARRKFQKQIALAAKAEAEASEFKKTADADKADLRNSLQQQSDRVKRLERDLTASRRDVETQTALVTKASADASEQKKMADAGALELRRSLLGEQERATRLEQDLATARYNLETQTALAAKEPNEPNPADGSADLRKSLQQERDRASRLERDLATARRDVETQTALVAKASDEVSQAKKTAEAASAGLQASLQQERDRAAQLERDLVSARRNAAAPSPAPQQVQASKSVATRQTPTPDSSPKLEDASDNTRLIAYAHVLLDRGDIGSARIVLQRAADMGSAEASFALAESYDPLVPSKWGTYGTRGDPKRALELYAKALAGGIKQAKERSDALHR